MGWGISFERPTIAFDFDHTITTDFRLFKNMMLTFRHSGFRVIVVTYRHKSEYDDRLEELAGDFKIFFTGRVAKRKYMKEQGVKVGIWVDDQPETILYSLRPDGFFDTTEPHWD